MGRTLSTNEGRKTQVKVKERKELSEWKKEEKLNERLQSRRK